jgi:membrane protein YqaA with SNARE-associated domain
MTTMTDADITDALDIRAKLADIDRALARSAQAHADHDRKRQEIRYAPWALVGSGLTSGAALFAAGAAFMKLFG